MSSNGEEVAAAEGRQQRRADAVRDRAGALEEKEDVKEEPRDTQSKLLDLLTGLTEHMERMEASQGRLEEKERLKGHEAIVSGSVLGKGKAMIREVLDVLPPRRVSPAYRHQRTYVQDSLDTPVQRPMLRWRKRRNQYCLSITCHHTCTIRRPHHTWHQDYNTIVCRIRDRGSWASDLLMARNCIKVSEVGFYRGARDL